MALAGYSGKPLIRKLSIAPQMRVLLHHAPANYMELLGEDISNQLVTSPPAELVHLFCVSRHDLETRFTGLIGQLPPKAMVWISWYKRSAKIPTDITEDSIREIVLPLGWVDVKVCAVSVVWSGWKIVRRTADKR